VNDGAGDTHGNPAPIVDRETGRILLAETYNTGRTDGHSCDVPCDRTPHLQYSDDDGLSWSAPRDLSDEILPKEWNSWYATGAVYVSGREQDGTDLGHRTHTVSHDGGDSFAAPFRAIPDLYAPQVQCPTLRLGPRMLLACPGDPDRRRTMTIRSSYDGGRTWD